MSMRNVPFNKRFPKKATTTTTTTTRVAASKTAARAQRQAVYASRRHPAARVPRDRLGENKYFDTAFANSIGTDSAAATLVTDLAIVGQGNTVQTRIGKKLRCLRLQCKGTLYQIPAAGAGTSPATDLRVSIVWDREPDKAALVPVTTDVYMANSSTALTNRDNAPRFKILKEMRYSMPGIVTVAGNVTGNPANGTTVTVNEYLDFSKKDLEIIWTKADTTGATAAKVKGNLLLVFTSDQTVAAGGVYAALNFRLDYEDEASKQSKR